MITTLVTFIILLKCCNLTVVINSTPEVDTPISTTCNLPDEKEGYCVPLNNCLKLSTLNTTSLEERSCGPRNENFTNTHVCCELEFIQLGNNSAIVQSPEENCGIQNLATRILGGNPSSEKEFPWLARLLRRDNQGELIFSCSGSLINSKVVITSAHCLKSTSFDKVGDLHAVSLGEYKTEEQSSANKKIVLILNFIIHPGYDETSTNRDNDIGLVILKDKVAFSDYISPICLLQENVQPDEYYVAGWGKTESSAVSNVKLKAILPAFAWRQCRRKYRQINIELTSRQICAGGLEGVDSCQGDSGGPLMLQKNYKWHIAGIVSFGVGCGKQGWPAVYIYVPSYINWINANIK